MMGENKEKIIIAFIIFVLGLISLVIFWPKLTSKKPPKLVEDLRGKVKGSKIGKKLLNIDDKTDVTGDSKRPLDTLVDNSSQVIKEGSVTVVEKIREEITKLVIEKSSEKIVEKLNQLPEAEKKEVKEIFCK